MSEHVTQNGVECSFLLRFLHRDEMFWAKSPYGGNGVPIADAGSDLRVCQGSVVKLDGRRSKFAENDVTVEWTQTKGPEVRLEEKETLTPWFVAPELKGEEESEGVELEFELRITSYGGVKGFPTSVVVVNIKKDNY